MYCKKIKLIIAIVIVLKSAFAQKYSEKEIAIPAKPDSLYGTLIHSKNEYLCIFHPGSGPINRDGNDNFIVENNSIKKLSDSLEKHHISSFRYDKRGVGKSKNALESEDSVTIYTYVSDLLKVIDFFSKKPYKYKKIILIGHSEGALIATLAAQKSKKISKLILIAGAGYKADTILKRQLSYLHENAKKIIFPLIDTLASGKRVDNIPPTLSFFLRESVQNYIISWLSIDPAKELSKIKKPTIIIQGENDIQISVRDAERLKEFKKDAYLKIIPKMNHTLVDAPKERKENIETYRNTELALSKELVPTIVWFIKKK